jgi:hypothetical protein
VKLCECGCGEPAPIAKMTSRRDGHIKGQPVRFISGHSARVRYGPWTDRYWSQVDKNGPIIRPELGPCWLWIGTVGSNGYGQIMVNGRRGRPAHHVALELAGWIIPCEWLEGLHKCDNPPCVNPAHLRIGTTQDNTDDMVSKGRQARGECNGRATLTQVVVDEIRRLYAAGGWTKRALAQRFGVSDVTIGNIIAGRTWKQAA